MRNIIGMMICLLTLTGCSSKANKDLQNEEAENELISDTTNLSQKDYPNYSYSDFDTKTLAELLEKEKSTGLPNDSSFTNFLKRCGMEYGDLPEGKAKKGFIKTYSDHSCLKVISDYRNGDDGKMHHILTILFPEDDANRLQWMTVQLRAFGMKDVKSESVNLQGKGLRCLGKPGRMEIDY